MKVELENGDSEVAIRMNKADGSPDPDVLKIDMSSSQDSAHVPVHDPAVKKKGR